MSVCASVVMTCCCLHICQYIMHALRQVLSSGRLVEQGAPSDLAARSGTVFARLLDAASLEPAKPHKDLKMKGLA